MKPSPLVFVTGLLYAGLKLSAATLPVAEDSFSSRGQLTAATNKAATLKVDSTHSAYLYFDLSQVPANSAAQIRYARLRLFLTKVTAAGAGIEVHTVTSPWDEALASTEPTHAPGVTGSLPPTEIPSKHFASVDVTTAVRAWVDGSANNQGFEVVSAGGANVSIGAKEGPATGYPAELDIELNPDAGSITASQLAPDLTLAGTTTGTFTGNGSGLQSLSAANLSGQLANNQLANSTVTVTAGSGLSGGGSAALGGAITLNNAGVLSLTSGGGVTVSASTGTVTLGSNASALNEPGSIVSRDANGDFAAGRFSGTVATPSNGLIVGSDQLVTSGGFVGIGTTTPNRPLQIAPTNAGRGMQIGYGGDTGGFTQLLLDLSATTDGTANIQAIKAAGLSYGDLVLNKNGGNVGIGTDTPLERLHVNGSLAFTGALRIPGAGEGSPGSAFIQVTTAGNVTTTIDHPLCNGDPNALLFVTHRAAGDINDAANRHNHVMGVNYFNGHWYIYNEDFAFMPAGVQFNVLVVKP